MQAPTFRDTQDHLKMCYCCGGPDKTTLEREESGICAEGSRTNTEMRPSCVGCAIWVRMVKGGEDLGEEDQCRRFRERLTMRLTLSEDAARHPV